ncbi:FadR/GntR family transcriptional regulator [Pseudaquabacterium rugosum]|uniref:FadR/GntR family transcriptional regulator n=1 Tax=Pseudaquabacterium rugosum TaxID=2984194 RepID=A0ABU9BDQ3_9BURK
MSETLTLPTALTTAAETAAPRPRSLAQRLVETLCAEMRDGVLPPGTRLPTEPVLMARFQVSRTVVREAMSRLQAAGWVLTRHGVGTFVCDPADATGLPSPVDRAAAAQPATLEDKLALLELRMGLESDAAALAAQRRSETQLAQLAAQLEAYAGAVSTGQPTASADALFHLLVAQATGNRHFEDVLRHVSRATIERGAADAMGGAAGAVGATGAAGATPRPALQVTAQHPLPAATASRGDPATPATDALLRDKSHALAEHRAIYDAIRRGDPQAARAAMFLHLDQSRQRLRALAGLG